MIANSNKVYFAKLALRGWMSLPGDDHLTTIIALIQILCVPHKHTHLLPQ